MIARAISSAKTMQSAAMAVPSATEPRSDCALCPRLAAFRDEWRAREPAWHNAPVPSFGEASARLLIVGLAPGLRGANASGRPFTGDYAGDLLYATLAEFGFSEGVFGARADDGLRLKDCRITNAVRCVPPENKPVGREIAQCRPFLAATIAQMPRLAIVLALGHIAHESVVRALAAPLSRAPFEHGGRHRLDRPGGEALVLHSSYHCSRYNTNTGRLTPEMFRTVFAAIRAELA